MRAQFGVRACLVPIGFTAAVAQIVLLRELMVVFYGNEISLGLMLGSWLFWTAAGSSLAGRFTARTRPPRRWMAGIQVLIAAILPTTVLAVRAAKGLLQTVPGEVLGPGAMLLTSFVTLGPLCLLSGALFTVGSKLYAASASATTTTTAATTTPTASATAKTAAATTTSASAATTTTAAATTTSASAAAAKTAAAATTPGASATTATAATTASASAAAATAAATPATASATTTTTASTSASAAAAKTATTTPAGEAAGAVYLWEAVGSAAGGLVAGLLLVRYWSSLEIACLLTVVNLLAAFGLGLAARPLRYAALGLLVAIAAGLGFAGGPQRLEAISQKRFWRGLQLVATRNSLYGSLAVVGTEGSRTVYENGVVLFNVPDPAAAEEAVHYALLEHPSPRSLLLIGGGLNGSIAQALRHPTLERVDYVELDPAILELARDCFPSEWLALRADPRVHVHVTDGRLFLKTTESTFDVVIVNLPEPQNAQLNRFFTVEFFREASRKLTPAGLLSFQLRSSENYMSAELAEFLRSINQSLRAVFPEVTAIPGDTVHFFAARQAGTLASGADELLARLHARHLATSYVSEYFIPYRMTPDRMADLEAQLRAGPGGTPTPVNRDFAPVAYYFDVALWSSQFNQGYRRLFGAMAGVGFGALAAAFAVVLAALMVGGRTFTAGRRRAQFAAGFSTAAMGFTMIGLEMLLLLAFQAVYGYVYRQLAVVIAAFMAGMALGSWLALRRGARGMRVLAVTQVLAAAAPLVLLGLIQAIGRASGTLNLVASQIAFPALALASGMLGGFEFPVASRMVQRPGRLYALDLAGSCLGAVLFSAWLVPVFGFFKTALLAAMVSLAPAATATLEDSMPPPGRARRIPGR